MFHRYIITELQKWRKLSSGKPLVIRGARQVGKTTVVNQFAEEFKQYIYLNLELPEDRKPFEHFSSIETLIQAIFFTKNKTLGSKDDTLVFIDEIQAYPDAIGMLRYFYEQVPEIPVVAAGSMLETLLDNQVKFPVGRVEFKVLRPVSFPEFLMAMGEDVALDALQQIPIVSFAHSKLLALFHTYAILGGMPEIIQHYVRNRDLVALNPIFDSLLASYIDDVEKYATNDNQAHIIRHAVRSSFSEAGKRFKFQGFGNSAYGSREMSEALRALQKAMILHIIYPETGFRLPLLPDLKKSPRLQLLDTGIMNYFAGIRKEILNSEDLGKVYQGQMIEHLIGQELLAFQYEALSGLHFWVREKRSSMAEVDFVFPYEGKLIPIEVKSGSQGKLRSLHQFMEETPHQYAVRFYAGEVSVTQAKTPKDKAFQLLNLPYYCASQIEKYLKWFVAEAEK